MKTSLRNSGVCLLLAIIFSCGTLHAQKKISEKALLWKVSGNKLKQPSYLFGTYHLLGDKFLTEVPETQQPFADAAGVVVELVIDSAKMVSIMMSKGIMLDKKISTLLSAKDFKLVDSVLYSVSEYRLKTFDMFKPVQIGMMIGLFQTQKLNAELLQKYSGAPLDIHFANSAKKNGKTVTPLETMEQQFDMLYNHFTVEEQAQQLIELVKNTELSTKASVDMTKLYIGKDIQGLADLLESLPKELSTDMDHLLKDRNERWIKVLPALMQSGSQFIAIGAGHLPGPDGLIALLRKEGYTVKPVTK